MGIFDTFRRTTESKNTAVRSDPTDTTTQITDPPISLPANIIGGRMVDFQNTRKNRYSLADSLYTSDERLWSAIELMAIMISKSIGDVSITVKDDGDSELSNEEKNAIKEAQNFARTLKIKKLFYRYTIDLFKYGDAIDLIKFNSKGVVGLQPLPMMHVTAVDKRSQINQALNFGEPMIQDPKFYVVDEGMTHPDVKDQIYRKERILHISFNPERNLIRDNKGRWTMSVWSDAPINSLIAILEWKQNLIRNDMIWSNRALPREHHKIDLSQYSMDKFPGNFAEKQTAALLAGQKAIQDYNDNVNKRREADQGFISSKSVEINYVEPKTTNWLDPSAKIDQINQLIGGPTGTPSALMGGESKGFTSVIHSSSFLALRAEIYAGIIQDKLEELMKRHVGIARPGIRKSVVDRLYIKNRLILDRDRAELARMISVLDDTGKFTPDEIRSIWGLEPLTDKQKKQIKEFNKMVESSKPKGFTSTQEDLLRKKSDSPTGGQESQGKRENDQNQTGDDRGKAPI